MKIVYKREKKNSYLRTCKTCKEIYRTTHKKSRVCPECMSCNNVNSKHYNQYLNLSAKSEFLMKLNNNLEVSINEQEI